MWRRRLKTPIAVLGLRLYTVNVVLVGRWGNVGPTGECRVSFRHIRGPPAAPALRSRRSDTSRDGSAGTRVPLYRGSRVSRARRAAVSLCLYPGISRVTGESRLSIYHASRFCFFLSLVAHANFRATGSREPRNGEARDPLDSQDSSTSDHTLIVIHICAHVLALHSRFFESPACVGLLRSQLRRTQPISPPHGQPARGTPSAPPTPACPLNRAPPQTGGGRARSALDLVRGTAVFRYLDASGVACHQTAVSSQWRRRRQ